MHFRKINVSNKSKIDKAYYRNVNNYISYYALSYVYHSPSMHV